MDVQLAVELAAGDQIGHHERTAGGRRQAAVFDGAAQLLGGAAARDDDRRRRAAQPSGNEPTIAYWNVRRSEARISLVTRGVINVLVVVRA